MCVEIKTSDIFDNKSHGYSFRNHDKRSIQIALIM